MSPRMCVCDAPPCAHAVLDGYSSKDDHMIICTGFLIVILFCCFVFVMAMDSFTRFIHVAEDMLIIFL